MLRSALCRLSDVLIISAHSSSRAMTCPSPVTQLHRFSEKERSSALEINNIRSRLVERSTSESAPRKCHTFRAPEPAARSRCTCSGREHRRPRRNCCDSSSLLESSSRGQASVPACREGSCSASGSSLTPTRSLLILALLFVSRKRCRATSDTSISASRVSCDNA